jgi:hypothetical protein
MLKRNVEIYPRAVFSNQPPDVFQFGQRNPDTSADLSPTIEATDWGQALRLNTPITIDGVPMRWGYPARKAWLSRTVLAVNQTAIP